MSGNQRQTSTEDSTGKANQSGFTLVEVLVAFAILSIVLISLLEGISIASRGNFRAEFDRAALRLAKAQLEAIGVTVPLVAGVATGRFDNGLEWALSVRPYTPGSVSNALPAYWVEIVVRRPFDADGSSLTRALYRRLGSPPSLTMMTLKLVRPL
jgi:prepilin-type N-terminal cleavage/methylation domain-containing protein